MKADRDFPRLTPENHRPTSPAAIEYNCIAWAASDVGHWWQPGVYWPVETEAGEYGIEVLEEAFKALGFVPCDDDRLIGGSTPARPFSYQTHEVRSPLFVRFSPGLRVDAYFGRLRARKGERLVLAAPLAELINRVKRGELNTNQGREVLAKMIESSDSQESIIASGGYQMVSDRDSIAAVVAQAVVANPQAIEELAKGKKKPEAVKGFLRG